MTNARPRHPVTLWLAAGMLGGLALAMAGLMLPAGDGSDLPEGAVARVDGHIIPRDAYAAALASVATDKRDPLSDADRRRVLDQLVNESLLVRHGTDLDLVRQTPRLRDQLVDAVLQGIRAEAESEALSQGQVREFYRQHEALFTGPDLLHVGVLRTGDRAAAERARQALREGATFDQVHKQFDDGTGFLPDGLLPADKLRDYLGPTLAQRAGTLAAGEAAGPVESDGRFAVLALHTRQPAEPPPLAQVESAVRQEMRRRLAESLLQERLAALRERYPVRISPDVPQ